MSDNKGEQEQSTCLVHSVLERMASDRLIVRYSVCASVHACERRHVRLLIILYKVTFCSLHVYEIFRFKNQPLSAL